MFNNLNSNATYTYTKWLINVFHPRGLIKLNRNRNFIWFQKHRIITEKLSKTMAVFCWIKVFHNFSNLAIFIFFSTSLFSWIKCSFTFLLYLLDFRCSFTFTIHHVNLNLKCNTSVLKKTYGWPIISFRRKKKGKFICLKIIILQIQKKNNTAI